MNFGLVYGSFHCIFYCISLVVFSFCTLPSYNYFVILNAIIKLGFFFLVSFFKFLKLTLFLSRYNTIIKFYDIRVNYCKAIPAHYNISFP
jgi:hypothetical protein